MSNQPVFLLLPCRRKFFSFSGADQALQRTPGFGVQLPGAALVRPAQSRAVLPAVKPGTARAFAFAPACSQPRPRPGVAELGVVRRRYPSPVNANRIEIYSPLPPAECVSRLTSACDADPSLRTPFEAFLGSCGSKPVLGRIAH